MADLLVAVSLRLFALLVVDLQGFLHYWWSTTLYPFSTIYTLTLSIPISCCKKGVCGFRTKSTNHSDLIRPLFRKLSTIKFQFVCKNGLAKPRLI